jgi:HD-GYP domain-containing protein (c-di-GMP phosphodiesterase class II)
LSLVANTAAVAIQNAQLFADAKRRLENVQALHAIDLAISGNFELRAVLDIVLEQVTSQLQVDAAAVHLLNPESQLLEHAASRGFQGTAIEQAPLRPDRADLQRLLNDQWEMGTAGQGHGADPFERPDLAASEGFAGHYAVPLITKGQLLGILEVFQRRPFEPGRERHDFLIALAAQTAIAVDNARLVKNLQTSNAELVQAYDATIEGWSRAMDLRDHDTEGHSQRVTELTVQLARARGFDETALLHIRHGALLHDIGKMGVPDAILLKPGPLSAEEWALMHLHPTFAYQMLAPTAYLRPALDIPYCHHEKWDGTGYPRGLAGTDIPIAARMFALVDVWDALRSDRPYRRAWTIAQVQAHIRSLAGTSFDPDLVELFLEMATNNPANYPTEPDQPE